LNKDYNKDSILALLYGNQRGGIGVEFTRDPKLQSVEITWLELFQYSSSIQIWGCSPATRDFRNLFKGLSSNETKTSLFVRMSEEVFGDRSLTYDLISSFNNYINTRLHAKQRNKRERRVLNDSLFAYISNMGTDHSKLITRLTNSKNVLLNHKRRYRTEYDKLCNDEATSSLPSYRNAFLSMTN